MKWGKKRAQRRKISRSPNSAPGSLQGERVHPQGRGRLSGLKMRFGLDVMCLCGWWGNTKVALGFAQIHTLILFITPLAWVSVGSEAEGALAGYKAASGAISCLSVLFGNRTGQKLKSDTETKQQPPHSHPALAGEEYSGLSTQV